MYQNIELYQMYNTLYKRQIFSLHTTWKVKFFAFRGLLAIRRIKKSHNKRTGDNHGAK